MHVTPKPEPFIVPTDADCIALAAILKSSGLRATTPRINALHYLNTIDIPVSIEMVSRCVGLPLSTAYRTMATLETASLAGVTFGRSSVTRWFRFKPENPQHCTHCGQSFYGEYA